MFSKFSRIGAEPVKWQFTLHVTKLSLPSLKSACVVVSRGDSKVQSAYSEPVKGYFTFAEPLTIVCTLYRRRDKNGNGVYLPKEGEVRILEKGKAKEAGVVAIDFSEYVSESRAEVESLDNNWRIEKTADKYNNFMMVNITAKRLGPGGADEVSGTAEVAVRKEEVKEAGEADGENEAEDEDREWKKRNTLPASKDKQRDAKQIKWKDEDEEDEEAGGDECEEEDEPLEDDEDDSPKKKLAPPAAAKGKAKPATARDDDDDEWSEDEDDIIRRLKGLKADGKLAPSNSKPAATAGKAGVKADEKKGAAVKGKPASVKKDKSQMTAKELLFAESSDEEEKVDEEEEVKPKRGAAGKASAVASKPITSKEEASKGGDSKTTATAAAGRAAKTPSWEIVIPAVSSTSPPLSVKSSASNPSTATLPAQPIPANRLFSCTLAEANTVYPSSVKSPPAVPYILTFLLQQLEKCNAFFAPSLFKQYVDPSQVTALRTQLEQGNWKLKGSHSDNPQALGGVLKLWVGGLQDGLVGEALVADVLQVGMMEGEDDEDVKAAVKGVSARLSPQHRASLVVLLQFLQTMTLPLNVRKNGMKVESLASAWGAAIVRMKADPKKSAYDQFSDKANVNRFVQYSIQHLDAVKTAIGAGAGAAGAAGGRSVVAARQVEEEADEENAGDEEDEVLKEDEEGEEPAQEGSDGEVDGLRFHHDEGEEEESKPKGKGKPLTARERLDQERQEREKQKAEKEKGEKARMDKEKADKERVEREKVDKLKADKEKADKADRERKEREEKDRKEKERRDKEDRERKEKERKDKEEKERREREEREKKEKEKPAVGKKVGAAAAAFKPATNVFGDSDLEDEDDGEQVQDDEDEQQEEDEQVEEDDNEEEEEVKTIQPKGNNRTTSSPAVATSNKVDRELISRQQAELDSLRKQLADTQSKQSTLRASSSTEDVAELKTKLVAALKEKDGALRDKREADRKLTALETERESQKKMIDKLQKMLVQKGKLDATQLGELNEASKGKASPAPPPPPPAGGASAGKLSEHLSVMQLKYDAVVEEMEQKLANEKQIRKQLKQQLEALTEENSSLRQRSMHFDQLVQSSLTPSAVTSPSAASQGTKKTKDELLGIVAQQYERISFLEHTMRENEAMMRQAKQAWADSARIMEDEMEHKDDELKRMKDGYDAAVQDKGVEWVGEEEWKKRVERLKKDKDRCEREKKEMEDEVKGKRVELQEAMKSILQLEDDTRLLKEELTRTGIALKTIAEDNFELKEWMRLHSKGKKG